MSDLQICKNCVYYAPVDVSEGQCYRPTTLHAFYNGVENVYFCDCCEKFERIKKKIGSSNKGQNVK